MTQVLRMWPLLTGLHKYDKSLSTRNRGHGQTIEAPILAYLIETKLGRILYDVGCDYAKIADPLLRDRYYDPESFPFGPPEMREEDRIPHHLERLGLTTGDVETFRQATTAILGESAVSVSRVWLAEAARAGAAVGAAGA